MTSRSADDTARLAARLATLVRGGDCLTLSGPLGVGKTEFARAFIRERLGDPAAEVPSPTFTLVQYYDGDIPVVHADLYRIEAPDEWLELGLDEALDQGVALVEWAEHAEAYLPKRRLMIQGTMMADGTRVWTLVGDEAWEKRLSMAEVV